jgi:hypothetical protein
VSAATGVPFTFTVSASGGVVPSFTEKGRLPGGVAFVDDGDGTATMSGTPVKIGHRPAAGTYRVRIKAVFAYGTAARTIAQTLVVTVS